jgi:PDZ domain-containing protein/aspartyl protease
VKDLDVGVIDLGNLGNVFGEQMGGILGANFFSRFQLTIDYGTRTLTLAPPSTPLPSGQAVPLEITAGIPAVQARIGEESFRMFVDTGASMTTLPARVAARLKVGKTRPVAVLGADLKPVRLRATRLATLTAAGQTVPNLVVAYGEAPEKGSSGSLLTDFANGLLGNNFLRRFRITLDYGRQQAVFAPSPKAAAYPDEWTQPGLVLAPGDGDEAVIVTVHPDSPAAQAGLKPNDRVTALNGRPVKGLNAFALLNALCGAENTTVRLTVTRDGKPKTYVLKRVRLL